ncbi:MAG: PKD domain-containing protein [Caldilinea sp.]|nr:PKD domain-containing protein [Caldilinea sp.]MDW8438919.1 PKD domain-containing protein [Caldilineaceae bacterium]
MLKARSARQEVPHFSTYWAIGSGVALFLLLALAAALLWPAGAAFAQGGPNGVIAHDTVAHFSSACTVLTDTIVSSANGGEIRLRATVEDYFDGDAIDTTQWITGYSNPSYPDQAPLIGSGVLTLYGSYLRSAQVFSATTPTRFFEASARMADVSLMRSPSNVDIGFYRAYPPLQLPPGDQSSIRLFIGQPTHSTVDRLLYVRSRDGTVAPVVDTMVNNWGDDENAQRAGLSQYRTFRIEWGPSETWYLIDGSVISQVPGDNPLPHTGVSTRTTYVFLYNQDPLQPGDPNWGNTMPLLVDWVRAGVYPSNGQYTSCILDAGQIANWSQATVTATVLAQTGASLQTRTSVDGVTWSSWASAGTINNGVNHLTPSSPSGRYLQYRLILTSTNPIRSPEVAALSFSYFGPSSLVVAPASATLNPGATQQFTATAYDGNNAVVNSVPVSWSVVNGGGVIDGSGLFTAGLSAGVFTNTVRATTSNNVTGTATVTVLDLPPIAVIGGPYAGLEGQPVQLNAGASSDPNGGPLTFAWDLNNNGQFDDATGAAPSASWPDNGVYTIGLLVTDSAGLTDTATTTVTIANVNPQITSINRNTPVRRGEPVTVTVTATDVPSDTLYYSFDWTGNGVFDVENTLSNTAVTTYPNTGLYTVTVRVIDDDGGVVTETTTVTVTPQSLSATATNDGPVRRGQNATVSVNAVQELNDPLTYAFDWDNNGVYDVTTASPSAVVSYTTTGAKTVGVRVTDADGGVATTSTVVTVTPQSLSATATNDGPVRRGQNATVSVNAVQELNDPLTYGFDFDYNGAFEVVQPSNVASTSFAGTGVKPVGYGVTDGQGAVVTGTTYITVMPQLLNISNVSNSGPVVRNQPVTVIVTATQELSDPLTYSFDWNNDGVYEVVDQVGNSAATGYPTAGDYTVRVRVRDADGGEATATTTVRVNAQIIQITQVTNNAPKRRGQAVTVSVTAVQQLNDPLLYSFDWNNDGIYEVVDQPGSSASTIYASTGAKTVRVRVRDSQNSEATATTSFQITPQSLSATATNDGPVRRGQNATVSVNAVQELNDPLTYAFDWDNNGVYDVTTASPSAVVSYTTTGAKTVGVRVTDADDGVATVTTTIQVNPQNLAITSVTNSGPVAVGDSVLVTVNAVQELNDPLLYSFDWDDDGTYDVVDQPLNSASTSYATPGERTVRVRVRDGDGAEATGTTLIQVQEVGGGGSTEFLYLPIVSR